MNTLYWKEMSKIRLFLKTMSHLSRSVCWWMQDWAVTTLLCSLPLTWAMVQLVAITKYLWSYLLINTSEIYKT